MRKFAMFIVVVMIVLVSAFDLRAATLAGVTLPDAQQVGSAKLVLNGMGLRTKYFVKVYVAGLYVQQKSQDPKALIAADAPKRIIMQFVRSLSKSQLADGFSESFTNNSPAAMKTMKAAIDQFLGALEPVKEGEQMMFTYDPGTGTTFALNGKEKLTLAGPAFAQVLFSVWLGPKPPTADLKKGLLGQ